LLAILALGADPWNIARGATPEEIDAAILKGQQFLLSQMKNGNCETVPEMVKDKPEPNGVTGWQWGGLTSVATYGILASGVKPSDPRIAPTIEWLAKARIYGYYASGFRAQVWTFLPEKAARANSAVDFKLLLSGIHPANTPRVNRGFYPYFISPDGIRQERSDHSVSQIAVLGMWACEQSGQQVPTAYWQMVDEAWKKAQKPDGGWPYDENSHYPEPTATMTLAGVATLYITQDYLFGANRWTTCNGGIHNPSIDRGLEWIDRNIDAIVTGKVPNAGYALYGLERVGVASGRKFFGTTDWYRLGADYVISKQGPNGAWNGPHGEIPDTVFCIQFLVHGRAPVVLSKLEYDNGNEPAPAGTAPAAARSKADAAGSATARKGRQVDPWSERPRDAANFAHWSGRQIEQYLNWQVVNLRVPSSELHDAPILYIAGSEPLIFDEQELGKLRSFVEEGGLILGNADCGSDSFSKSFMALGRELFPKYPFRDLPGNHSIFVDQQYKAAKWKTKPKIAGLSNGVRELMLLIPKSDAGRFWQMRAEKTNGDMFELMQNILFYTVGTSNLRHRGDTYIVEVNPAAKAAAIVQVARLIVGDNPDPEPGGWRRLAAVLNNEDKIGVTVTDVKLGEGKLTGNKIAHLTGTTKFTLTEQQKKELKDFVAAGGTLIVDAAGGSAEFAESAEHELAGVFGGKPTNLGEVLPPNHEVFAMLNAIPEEKRGPLYRRFAVERLGALKAPRVRGIAQRGRAKVFYSAEDLSAGLVGEPVDGVFGYSPEAATNIMRGIVKYVISGK
jgi:hypothetical protein